MFASGVALVLYIVCVAAGTLRRLERAAVGMTLGQGTGPSTGKVHHPAQGRVSDVGVDTGVVRFLPLVTHRIPTFRSRGYRRWV